MACDERLWTASITCYWYTPYGVSIYMCIQQGRSCVPCLSTAVFLRTLPLWLFAPESRLRTACTGVCLRVARSSVWFVTNDFSLWPLFFMFFFCVFIDFSSFFNSNKYGGHSTQQQQYHSDRRAARLSWVQLDETESGLIQANAWCTSKPLAFLY